MTRHGPAANGPANRLRQGYGGPPTSCAEATAVRRSFTRRRKLHAKAEAGHYVLIVSVLIVALVLGASLSAITPPTVKFTDTKLKNGLRLIIAEDHSAPVFSIAVVYNVGSRD